MKDYRVEVRVKNNLLYGAIMEHYKSVAEFCREAKISQVVVGSMINMKHKSIYTPTGKVYNNVKRVCKALGKGVGELFPVQYYLEKNSVVVEMDKEEMISLRECEDIPALPYYDNGFGLDDIEFEELKDMLKTNIKDRLTPRQRRIIEGSFFENVSDVELSREFDTSKQNIAFIRAKALEVLKKSKLLRKYMSSN